MDEAEFKHLTEPRDRRREDPNKLRVEIVDEGEELAYHLHCIWCDEANKFESPVEYAKYKICAEIVIRPEPLRELLGDWPLALLNDDKMAHVVKLAERDGEVWYYVKKWFLDGLAGDPRPDSVVSTELTELIRRMVRGDNPKERSKPPPVGIPDEVISDVASQLYNRFGCKPHSAECLDALGSGLIANR